MLSIYCTHNENTQVFTGKTLMMGGSSQSIDPDNRIPTKVIYLPLLLKTLPFWADIMRTPDRDTTLMKDFEMKLKKGWLKLLSTKM